MNLRSQILKIGVGEYITIPASAKSRKQINALIYYYLLNVHPASTDIRSVCMVDGTVDPWLDGMRRELMPFLKRFAKCLEST